MEDARSVVKRKVCKDKCNIDGADGRAAAQKERAKASRKLTTAVVFCLIFMAAEIAGGIIANSLAILTDAAHLLSDIAGFAISLFAIWASGWEASPRRTFGYYRLEILGALLSIQIIWLVTGVLVYEAIARFIRPDKNIDGRIMFGVACSGLLVNITLMFTLGHEGHSHGHDHNHENSHNHNQEAHEHEHGHGHGHKGSHDHNQEEHQHEHGHEGEGKGHAPKITFCKRVAKFFKCHGEETHSYSLKKDHEGAADTSVKHKHEDEVHVLQGHDNEFHGTQPHEHDNEGHEKQPHEQELNKEPGYGHNEQEVHFQEHEVPGHVHEEQEVLIQEDKNREIQYEDDDFHRDPEILNKRRVKVDQDLCKKTERKNLNIQGAYLHALGDFIQSIGVMIAGAIIWCKPNLYVVDPICTLIFSVLVLGTTYNMVREIISVLMESTPREVDASALEKGLLGLSGVIAVHELHIWALTVGRCLLACHILAEEQADTDEVLQKVTEYCEKVYKISHVTIQVERDI